MMPAFYTASVPEFLAHDSDSIIGRQTGVTRNTLTELSAEQLEAWREQLPILRTALSSDSARDWFLLLEYPIPPPVLSRRVSLDCEVWQRRTGAASIPSRTPNRLAWGRLPIPA